jgi:hypothetical protein
VLDKSDGPSEDVVGRHRREARIRSIEDSRVVLSGGGAGSKARRGRSLPINRRRFSESFHVADGRSAKAGAHFLQHLMQMRKAIVALSLS